MVSTEPWTFGEARGSVFQTSHYRVFTTVTPGLITNRLPGFLEAALVEYTSRVARLPPPTTALDTYLVANRMQWSRLSTRLAGEGAGAFQTIPRGGLTTGGRAILYDIGTRDTFALAAHEGWHQFTQRTFATPLPDWLEEGLATTFEGFLWDPADPSRPLFRPWANLERYDQLRSAAASDALMPVGQLLTAAPAEFTVQGSTAALDYYSQIWALTMFLAEGEGGKYAKGLRTLVSDAAAGTARSGSLPTGPRSWFGAYFTSDLNTVEAEFRAFLGRIARSGAREQIVLGRSPLSLQ